MTRHEERVFRAAKPKTDLATLRSQLQRLKSDLEQYLERNRNSAMIAPLRQRIKELEATIGAAEERSARPRNSGWGGVVDGAAAQRVESGPRAAERHPPRRRPAPGEGGGDADAGATGAQDSVGDLAVDTAPVTHSDGAAS